MSIRRRDETAVRVLAERTSNGHSFEAYLLTECANSQTEREPQGGEEANAELDGQYKRLRRLGAKLAHKAQWHK